MRIAMLLSGGVDSATALKLLIDAGHTAVTAYYLKVWLEDELHYLGDCPWQEDLRYARAVCEQLDVPLTVMPLQDAYWQDIVGYTLRELKSGRTPSPDVFCNQRIKFKTFLEQLPDSSDYIASGHYARVIADAGRCQLLQGVDPTKDQSYFLSHLSQEHCSCASFHWEATPSLRCGHSLSALASHQQSALTVKGCAFLARSGIGSLSSFTLASGQGRSSTKKPVARLENIVATGSTP